MTDGDLFNLDRALTPRERGRLTGSRKGGTTQPNGYAALPGTGPKDETCGSCQHLVPNTLARTYWKCGLMQRGWTGGAATDVRRKAPACRRWEARHAD